ncbi:MAG: heme exporter protein CcmD [Alphaproteobacteria bacterium]
MKDYTLYIAAAWALTAVVLAILVVQSLWRSKQADRGADRDADG